MAVDIVALEHTVEALVSAHSAVAATGVARGIGSVVGGAVGRGGLKAIRGSAGKKVLDESIGLAFIRTLIEARSPKDDDEIEWNNIGSALLKIFDNSKVKRQLVAAFLADPASEEPGVDVLMDALEESGGALFELAGLGIDVDEFVHLLPGTITDELAWAAYQDDSPLRGFWQTAQLQKIATELSADRVAPLAPSAVREQLAAFLFRVEQWALARMRDLPYLDHAPDLDRLDQAVTVRVGVRKDAQPDEATDAVYTPAAARTDPERDSLTWSEATERHERLVVLADPGLGKSWLTHTHTRRLAQAARAALEDEASPDAIAVPVVVRCDAVGASSGTTFTDAVAGILVYRHPVSAGFTHWLYDHLAAGGGAFLLDALDETGSAAGNLRRQLQEWDTRGGRGTLIITSRLANYGGPPIPRRSCTEVELQPFTPTDVTAYIDAWQLAADARAQLDTRLSHPAVVGLGRIPLLLAMMCDLAAGREPLPGTRHELYGRMLRRFLRAEHREREVPADVSHQAPGRVGQDTEQRLLGVLRPLAAWFADRPNGWVNRMPANEIQAALRTAGPDFDELGEHSETVLNWLSIDSGILLPAGDSRGGWHGITFSCIALSPSI